MRSPIVTNSFSNPREFRSVFLQIKAIVKYMHAFKLATETHFLGKRRRRISSGAFGAAVSNLTREFLIGFNEDRHSSQQFNIYGSEGGIGFNQFPQ